MNRPSFSRSEEFDALTSGWGADDLDDLTARCELLGAYWKEHLPLSQAEHKIAKAMQKRLCELGGLLPADMPN